MSDEITLTLPYPPSCNRYWRSYARGGRSVVVVSEEAKAYRSAVLAAALVAGVRRPILGRVAVDVRLYPSRPADWAKRQRINPDAWDDSVRCIDLDNANKVLLDAIKGCLIDDDRWVRSITAERMEPDGEARVVLTVRTWRREA